MRKNINTHNVLLLALFLNCLGMTSCIQKQNEGAGVNSTALPSKQVTASNTSTPEISTPPFDLATVKSEVGDVQDVWTDGHLQIMVQIDNATVNWQLSVSQKAALSKGWQIRIYQQQVDRNYSDSEALILKDIAPTESSVYAPYTFFAEIPIEELQSHFNDRRDFHCQVVNESGKVVWDEDIYLSNNLSNIYAEKDFSRGLGEGGVLVGTPNLLSQNNSIFNHQGKFIVVNQPMGGFHSLSYTFDLIRATKITSLSELEIFVKEFVIGVYPYQEDGKYGTENAYKIPPEKYTSAVGLYTINFPADWIEEAFRKEENYYLRIEDKNGNLIKEEFFQFLPYNP